MAHVLDLITPENEDTPIPSETLERWDREWADRRAYHEVKETRAARAVRVFDLAFREALK